MDAKVLLEQIILGSDYSRSMKELCDYFCQFREKSYEEERTRKKNKSPLRPFSGSKSRDAF